MTHNYIHVLNHNVYMYLYNCTQFITTYFLTLLYIFIIFYLLSVTSELSPVASLCSSDGLDPVLTDIYDKFNTALYNFKSTTKVIIIMLVMYR